MNPEAKMRTAKTAIIIDQKYDRKTVSMPPNKTEIFSTGNEFIRSKFEKLAL
jgi:hypothetical protein